MPSHTLNIVKNTCDPAAIHFFIRYHATKQFFICRVNQTAINIIHHNILVTDVALLICSIYTCRVALNLGSLVIRNDLPLQLTIKREKETLSLFTDTSMNVSKDSAYVGVHFFL